MLDVETARTALGSIESESRSVEGKLCDAERLRRDLDQEFQKEIGTRTAGVSEVNQQRFDAFRKVGREVLRLRGRLVEVPNDALDAMIRAEATASVRHKDLEKSVRALDSYDRAGFKQGLVALAVLGVLILALTVFLATR